MIKTKLAHAALTIALLATATAANAASAWPSVTAQSIGTALPSTFEPSGLIYQANVQKLFIVSDEGQLAKMNIDGSGTPTVYTVGGDNEAVTVTSSTSTHVYIGIENPDSILQVNASTGVAGYSWNLTPWMTGTDNQGLEALAYVPNEYISDSFTADSTQGGLFYAGMQGTGDIYIFDINRSVNGSSAITYRKTISDPTNTTGEGADLADLYFDSTSGNLFALYDGANRIMELTTSGSVVSGGTRTITGNGQEGLYFNYSGNSVVYYISQDDNDYPQYNGVYKYSDVDNDASATVSDCNDNDATISVNQTYYRDADGDGLGLSSSTTSVCSLTAPTGYVSNSTDLNDTDYDNDGVSTVSDCNDSNSAISANQTYYRDADGDGLGTAATTSVVCSYNVTSGYVTNSSDLNDSDYDNDGVSTTSDCNDADSTISANQTYYRDADADGLGTAAVTSVICSYTVPTGYVTNSSDLNDSDYDNDGVSTSADCNDQNSTVSALLTVYQDFDGDGLGNPAVSTTVCALTAPTGYVTNNLDTDDSGVVTPTCSKVEYLNNTVDDDCDGLVNEWNTLSSNGIHPIYGSYNASSTTLYKATVTSIAGSTNGAIKVKFADGSGYRYQVFSTSTKNSTTVKSYNGTAYLLVTANHGRNSALVNAYTGAITDSAHIASVPTKIKVLLATLTLKIKK